MEPLKTFLLINDNEFCAGENFKDSINNILYNFLFDQRAKLEDFYNKMEEEINNPNNDPNKKIIKLYKCNGNYIINKLKPKLLQRNDFIYAGHDLPVWRNDPDLAEIKIMVITQDPRRSDNEMTKNGMDPNYHWISISTPFGLHSQTYRSHKNRGLVHYLFKDLQDELKKYNYTPEKLSIYYTDFYKFRGVASEDLDTENRDVYIEVLSCEIQRFDPNVILLMGKKAQDAWKTIYNSNPTIINSSNKPKILPTPHPNARRVTWGKKYPNKMKNYSSEEKRRMLLNDINVEELLKKNEKMREELEKMKDMI